MASEDDPLARRGGPGTSADGASAAKRIPSPPCAAGARSRSASPRRPGPRRRRRSSPNTCARSSAAELPDRGGVPHRPAVPRGGPAGDGPRLGGDRRRRCAHAGRRRAAMRSAQAYDRSSDLGPRVADVLDEAAAQPTCRVTPEPVAHRGGAAFAAIEAASGPAAQGRHLPGPPRALRSADGPYVVKVLTGELRIGLREGLVEAAIAKAFDRPLEAVKRAGDAHRRHRADGEPGPRRPARATPRWRCSTRSSSCSPRRPRTPPRSCAAWARRVWVEDKYDGIRAQLHRAGGEVRLYSRDLHDITRPVPGGGRGRAAT